MLELERFGEGRDGLVVSKSRAREVGKGCW